MFDLQAQTINPLQRFTLDEPTITARGDLDTMRKQGLTRWALDHNVCWQDNPLPWDYLPSIFRTSLVTDALDGLSVELLYALPFRHMGRVLTFALLPVQPRPIRVTFAQPAVIEQAKPVRPRERVYYDPPIPFPCLGAASPKTLQVHAEIVSNFLRTGRAAAIMERLWSVVAEMAMERLMTYSETFYYITMMRSVALRSWQQIAEFAGLQQLEAIISQADLMPGQAPALAHAHLIENRPIQINGRSVLDVQLRSEG